MPFSDWLNKTSMNSFRTCILTIVASAILLFFASLGGKLLLYDMPEAVLMHKDPAIRASAQTEESSHHNYGMQVVTAIMYFLTAAIVTGAAAQFGDRVTAKEHVEARERGRVSGLAAAAVAAQVVEDAKAKVTNGATKEHPAMEVHADQANITQEVSGGEARSGE